MKSALLIIAAWVSLVSVLENPVSAQYDGTTDGPPLSIQDVEYIRSCKANAKETELLTGALTKYIRSRPIEALQDLEKYRESAAPAPAGKWRTPRLKECYETLKKRITDKGAA